MRFDTSPAGRFALAPARVHEAEGPGRRGFALLQAARHSGPLIRVLPARAPRLPMLRGLPDGVGQRLHLVRTDDGTGLLWSAEESLPSPGRWPGYFRAGKTPVTYRRQVPATRRFRCPDCGICDINHGGDNDAERGGFPGSPGGCGFRARWPGGF